MKKKALVTAGPTRESIDPIRFISNRSSGKMGYAIAKALGLKGAHVKLISGPVELGTPSSVELTTVETAEEMAAAVFKEFNWADIIVMAAAVSDYKPASVSSRKIKKEERNIDIRLERTRDILLEMGRRKRADQILVGFALETEELIKNATKKLRDKNLDIVIANSEKAQSSDTADIWIIDRKGNRELNEMSKEKLGEIIADKLLSRN